MQHLHVIISHPEISMISFSHHRPPLFCHMGQWLLGHPVYRYKLLLHVLHLHHLHHHHHHHHLDIIYTYRYPHWYTHRERDTISSLWIKAKDPSTYFRRSVTSESRVRGKTPKSRWFTRWGMLNREVPTAAPSQAATNQTATEHIQPEREKSELTSPTLGLSGNTKRQRRQHRRRRQRRKEGRETGEKQKTFSCGHRAIAIPYYNPYKPPLTLESLRLCMCLYLLPAYRYTRLQNISSNHAAVRKQSFKLNKKKKNPRNPFSTNLQNQNFNNYLCPLWLASSFWITVKGYQYY